MKDTFVKVPLVLAALSTTVAMAAIYIHGSCSPIVIMLTAISAALWIWVFILSLKEKALNKGGPLISDLNIKIAAAVISILSILTIAGVATFSLIQGCR
jgi:hypothetical protein